MEVKREVMRFAQDNTTADCIRKCPFITPTYTPTYTLSLTPFYNSQQAKFAKVVD